MKATSRFRRGSARTNGLVAACLLALVFIGVIAWIVVSGPKSGRSDEAPIAAEPPPDVKNIGATGQSGAIAGAGKLFLQVVDPRNPTRVESEITAERSEPLARRRVRMESPRAWLYLEDGRSVHIQAERGEATLPETGTGGRPEDAILEGEVRVRMFAPAPGRLRPENEDSTPILSFTTERMRIDAQRGELEAPGEVSLRSKWVDFDGQGLTVLYNDRSGVVEFLRVDKRTLCKIHPQDSDAPGTTAAAPSSAGSPAAKPGSTARLAASGKTPTTPPRETLYHAQATGDVTLTQGSRLLTSDAADVWVRLINNELPPGAIAEAGKPAQARSTVPTPATATQAGDRTAATPQAERPVIPAFQGSEPIEVAWTGPLEIRPLSEAPDVLSRNHAHLRFSSARDSGVRFADPESKSTGTGMQLDYAATTREVAFSSSGERGARLVREGVGTAIAARFDGSLATGRVHVPGGGMVIGSGGEGEEANRQATWTSEADFKFAQSKGGSQGAIEEARLTGDAIASDDTGSITANQLVALFKAAGGTSAIERLTAVGKAEAKDAKGAGISGNHIDTTFAALPDGTSVPLSVTITGHARGRQDGNTLTADRIESTLATLEGRTFAEKLIATGNAEFTGAKGEHAAGPLITAYPERELVEFDGEGSSVGRGESTVNGTRLVLNGKERTLEVVGPGAIDHTGPIGGDDTSAHAAVNWREGLWYDDVAGIARCVGEATALVRRGSHHTDKLAAELIVVELGDAPAKEGDTHSEPGADRSLASLEATGQPATIEVRRYRPGVTPPVLERLMYLEGAKIQANNAAGRLDVPSAGKLLVMDRREAREQAPASPLAGPAGDMGRGTALFTWKQSLAMEKATGEVTMKDGVRLVHDRGDGSPKTTLDSTWLKAKVRQQNGRESAVASEQTFDADLLSASAGDGVRLLSGEKEITAATLEYDAVAATVDAKGGSGLVSLTDKSGKAPPAKASRILWYLKTDRIEATGVKPIVTPK